MLERLRGFVGGWLARLGTATFGRLSASLVGPGLPSARASEDAGWNLVSGGDGPADRVWSEIREDLQDSLEAWRRNAWVRQLVRLCTAYVVGDGIELSAGHLWVSGFVQAFVTHRQNRIGERLAAWNDELVRSGELFVALFSNPADGMQYVRAIPASQIARVETDPEDYERETGYQELIPGQIEARHWNSQHTAAPAEPCLVHFAVNKPVGATRGESDLTPLLPWARRYTDWLKDRVKYNKIRTELATAEIILDDDTQVQAKREQYRSDPPTSGSIFVHGRGEELKFPGANIASFEVESDGKAMRLAMATAGDIPLHFFSEGDSATRATAVEMGDPTHRFYRQRQQELGWFLCYLTEVAFRRRSALLGLRLPAGDLGIQADMPDISRADNTAMATAASTIVQAFATMADRGWITDELAVKLSFKFAGEILTDDEIEKILEAKTDGQKDSGAGSGKRGANGANGGEPGGNGRQGNAVLSTIALDGSGIRWGGDA
jgi:hypothetical protein